MTIAKRMLCLIALLAVSLLGLGGMAIYQLNQLGGDLREEGEVTMPALLSSVEMERDFLYLRTLVLTEIAADNATQVAQLERDIAASRAQIDRKLEEYSSQYVFDDTDRNLFEEVQSQLRDYYIIAEEIMAAARANDDLEALRLVNTKCAQGSARVKAAIDAHLAYNKLFAQKSLDSSLASAVRSEWMMGIVIAFALALGLLISWITYNAVVGSLTQMNNVVGAIASTLDFTRRVRVKGKDEAARTIIAFNALLDTMQNSLGQMVQNANQLSGAAVRLTDSASQVSVSSSEQSKASSSMAAAVEEMTTSITHVADRSAEANQLVTRSGSVAHAGAEVIKNVLQDIRHIEQAVNDVATVVTHLDAESTKVNSVVSVIKEVAEQINLLALNAAIEAARAGEQGRGFAVVADEVRKLAEHTTQSTQEISEILKTMQTGARDAVKGVNVAVEQVSHGAAHVEQAELSVREIETSSAQAVEMVNEISEAIREQGLASSSIAEQVEHIAHMTEENSMAASNTADTAEELSTLAKTMQKEVSRYHV